MKLINLLILTYKIIFNRKIFKKITFQYDHYIFNYFENIFKKLKNVNIIIKYETNE